MGDPDRLVAQRERARAEAQAAELAARQAAARLVRETKWHEVVAAVGPALASLERCNWSTGKMVTLRRRTLFGGYKPYSKAAREVCTYRRPWKDTTVTVAVHLLSDGRLTMDAAVGGITPIDEVLDMVLAGVGWWGDLPLDQVLAGLQALVSEEASDSSSQPGT